MAGSISRRALLGTLGFVVSACQKSPSRSFTLHIPKESKLEFIAMTKVFAKDHAFSHHIVQPFADKDTTLLKLERWALELSIFNDGSSRTNPFAYSIFAYDWTGLASNKIDQLSEEFTTISLDIRSVAMVNRFNATPETYPPDGPAENFN